MPWGRRVKSYPKTLSEADTVARAQAGCSLARFGDGEFKLALGANCVSQRAHPALAKELRHILVNGAPGLLVCIPNIIGAELPGNKAKGWKPYTTEKYYRLLGKQPYGSAFISRPDSAPWIDTPDYWTSIRKLWAGREVVSVTGRYNEIREDQLRGAAELWEVEIPRQHAYAHIDDIEAQVLSVVRPGGLVVMCAGPTATVLAARLQRRNIQALDLGHLGMFMRHAGQYGVQLDQLITMGYQDELLGMHAQMKGWGGDGAKHAGVVRELIESLKPKTILDYGCGSGELRKALEGECRILEYDPGVKGKEGMPKPVDLVICTDVVEHVEPKMLMGVLRHINLVAEVAAYFTISLRPAKHTLPGGRNAHLIVENASWWLAKLQEAGFHITGCVGRSGHTLVAFTERKAQ